MPRETNGKPQRTVVPTKRYSFAGVRPTTNKSSNGEIPHDSSPGIIPVSTAFNVMTEESFEQTYQSTRKMQGRLRQYIENIKAEAKEGNEQQYGDKEPPRIITYEKGKKTFVATTSTLACTCCHCRKPLSHSETTVGKCNHIFHSSCITTIMECPVCGITIPKEVKEMAHRKEESIPTKKIKDSDCVPNITKE
jgi:hypothetical protein